MESPVKQLLVLESSGNLFNSGNKVTVSIQKFDENKGVKKKRKICTDLT